MRRRPTSTTWGNGTSPPARNWVQNTVLGLRQGVAGERLRARAHAPPCRGGRDARRPRACVLPRGVGEDMVRQADAAMTRSRSAIPDGWLRIGYTSGSPEAHAPTGLLDRGRRAVRPARPTRLLAADPRRRPRPGRVRGSSVGAENASRRRLSLSTIGCSTVARAIRCQCRRRWPCTGDPFCESKSELRYFEPALVERGDGRRGQ